MAQRFHSITASTTESEFRLGVYYQHVWFKNESDTAVYISDKPNIIAGADGVAKCDGGSAVRFDATQNPENDVYYVKAESGSVSIQISAQIVPQCPFMR